MKTTPKTWKTAPISPTCEVFLDGRLCDKATDLAYPAMGGGWMALCYRHGQKHLPNGGTKTIEELISMGEQFALAHGARVM